MTHHPSSSSQDLPLFEGTGEISSTSIEEINTHPRPRLTSRRSSGTIIVPREHPHVEIREGEEIFDEDDARAMSPRRSDRDLQKMSEEAREQLQQYDLIIHNLFITSFA